MANNIIEVCNTGSRRIKTRYAYQYDYGQVLSFSGFELPMAFEVHFATSTGSITQIGQDNQVSIPDDCFRSAKSVIAWIYLHVGNDDGETRYEIEIPVKPRAEITDETPTPEEQSAIEQAIVSLNDAVERSVAAQAVAEQSATDAASSATDAAASATSASNSAAAAAGSVSEIAGYASSASTSATAAANSATDANASRAAADVSATNAGVSERNAAASASNAASSATAAAGSATEAANVVSSASGYANAAQASATAAAGSATAAAGSATDASSSASTANTKAGEAAASATAAENSATAAAGSATSAGNSATAAAGSATAAAGSAATAAQAVAGIEAAGATQVAAVEAAGQAVLESIPADYSALSQEVSDLNGAINVLEPAATSADVGKFPKVKTVSNGKVSEYEFGTASAGLTSDIKSALLACFAHVAWADDDGQDYYDALDEALNPPQSLESISAVYTQSGDVYANDSLDSLKSDLVVTAHYDDSSSAIVTTYTLSGTLTVGTSTITVSYGGKTDTFTVTVSQAQNILTITSSTSDAQYRGDTTITGVIANASSSINISGQTFIDCTGITFARFETTVSIFAWAFGRCTGLETITFLTNPLSLVASAFSGCDNVTDVYVPWAEGAVDNAPWGLPNTATIHYNYVPS